MSGWQRIGVVISILWLIGLPTYLMVDMNHRAMAWRTSCIINGVMQNLVGNKREVAVQTCERNYNGMTISPAEVIANLSSGGVSVWAVLLAPIAILWIVGGGTIWTVRWIGRGFLKNQGRASH
jgi:hypothetical protein